MEAPEFREPKEVPMSKQEKEFQKLAAENARKALRMPRRRNEKLKAERVQEELKRMPGWSLGPNGKMIVSAREFSQPAAAAKFAGFVAEVAASERQPVQLGLWGNWVFLTLSPRQGTGGLNMPVLDFARQLG
jgi:pterin-4a-carbinolamine dehydratase